MSSTVKVARESLLCSEASGEPRHRGRRRLLELVLLLGLEWEYLILDCMIAHPVQDTWGLASANETILESTTSMKKIHTSPRTLSRLACLLADACLFAKTCLDSLHEQAGRSKLAHLPTQWANCHRMTSSKNSKRLNSWIRNSADIVTL
jgi:hypothetical protein